MTDKRFAKVMIFSGINTIMADLFLNVEPYEFVMFMMVSMLVFNLLVSEDEPK